MTVEQLDKISAQRLEDVDIDTLVEVNSIKYADGMLHETQGDAFAARNKYALEVDDKADPPMFKVSDTHYAATWLLDPRAPKVEMPQELKARLERMKKEAKDYGSEL